MYMQQQEVKATDNRLNKFQETIEHLGASVISSHYNETLGEMIFEISMKKRGVFSFDELQVLQDLLDSEKRCHDDLRVYGFYNNLYTLTVRNWRD